MPRYEYHQQYADTEDAVPWDFKRIVPGNQSSQWGNGLTIAPGPYPPGYRVPNGEKGGGYPPQGQTSDGTAPIRLQPPSSGHGVCFQFVTNMTCTVINETDQDGMILIALGVIYPSETDRPLHPYLGVFHCCNDYRKMHPIAVPRRSSVGMNIIRLDVLDPDFADIPNWPNWEMVPAENKLWPAVGPTAMNPGPVPLRVQDIMAVGYAVPY